MEAIYFYCTSGPFHACDQINTIVEVRPDDCIDWNGAFHIWLYDINFGRMTLNLYPAGRTTNCL